MEEKKGMIRNVIYYYDTNSYSVLEVADGDDVFTAVGYLPAADKGRSFLFRGDWRKHQTYGEQFSFTEYSEEMPRTHDGITGFLSSGLLKGIGRKTAQSIVSRFGDETFNIIEHTPQRLTEIDGIGHVKAASISEAFQSHRELAEISLFFQQYGIGTDKVMKLYNVYGADTIGVVQKNPFKLAEEVAGIGFHKADVIAAKMGMPHDDEYRIASGANFILNQSVNEGHTFLPHRIFCERASELLEVSIDAVSDVVTQMVFAGELHMENLENRSVLFLTPYFIAEQTVCKNLITLNESKLKLIKANIGELIEITENQTGKFLADNQRDAVLAAAQNGVCVITGGPGTGKTTIINTIMKVFEFSGLRTAIAAPTGRAAKRITETSGYGATTIHRLLEYFYSEDESRPRFGKNKEDPLDFDVVIIDEASMVDILLMNGLLNAIKPGTRLIIVGDADQLPPVGAGNVLRDIIDSEIIHTVKLTEIFRQAKESLIVVNAHRIDKGEYPYCNEKDKDFFLLRRNSETGILDTIKELCSKRLPDYYADVDAVRDVQILTPRREKMLGSKNLNNELQKILNPPSPQLKEKQLKEVIFREGDKVMQIRNNYQKEWKRQQDFQTGQGVFNGDVGFIQTIDLEFNKITVIFDDSRFVQYDFTDFDELELAYAITVHKSQGSEFPIVLMPLTWFPPMLATRNLLYTAVTRAKQAVVLVGSERVMQEMVDNNRIIERYSGLSARLRKFLP
jgi:exodeoxyribonuclease V alpha subunit